MMKPTKTKDDAAIELMQLHVDGNITMAKIKRILKRERMFAFDQGCAWECHNNPVLLGIRAGRKPT